MTKTRSQKAALRSTLLAATSISALLGANAAYAQENQADTNDALEEIVVTGFRASLASALSSKRNSNLIQESITAEWPNG